MSEHDAGQIRASGHVQLLATIELDGSYVRGIARYPRIGDSVYSANSDILRAIVAGVSARDGTSEELMLNLGVLATGEDVKVGISASKLFGRHLAVLGATGGGKSWTLAHLMEEVAESKGRLLLIDATGEFHALGDIAQHVSIGDRVDAPAVSINVTLPHREFSEADRNAFFRPSGGSQLPKLRAAIRSLRLAQHLGLEHDIVNERGLIPKMQRARRPIVSAERDNAAIMEDPNAPFDLKLLPDQILQECIFDHDRTDETRFGGWASNDVSYCNSLVARVHDLLQTQVVTAVVAQPEEDSSASVLAVIRSWFLDESAPPILRVSLRNLAFSHHLREIVVNTIGRHLLALARQGSFAQFPLVVAIDEAHQFFGKTIGDESTSAALDAFDSIAKEGRKYGLTVCMATQRPGDLPSGVLSQAGMLIVHRLTDQRDRDRVEQASSEVDHSGARMLPSLVPGEALLVGADFPLPLPVRITIPERKPFSSGPNFVAWQATGR